MRTFDPDRVRRALSRRGIVPAVAVADAASGRADDAVIRPAQLLEDPVLRAHDVGAPEPWTEPVAFLDGTQRTTVVGYAATSPIVVAIVAAAVRERRDRHLTTVLVERRVLAVGRGAALEAAGDALDGFDRCPLGEEEAGHPIRELAAASRVVDRARGALELTVGTRYRAQDPGWLVVDGSLSESPAWAADARMIGVAKSHATLPFDGDALERYLRLPYGHRSSVFAPASRSVAPVRSWALRLWPWEGKDLFHGLVRIETSPDNASPDMADRISRWLLCERAPVSTPDPRWDRLLYGIHSVEQYLRATPT
jgi:hypothetical protein